MFDFRKKSNVPGWFSDVRLCDLGEDEILSITCRCGRVLELGRRLLIERWGLAPTLELTAFRTRLACQKCKDKGSAEIAVQSTRFLGTTSRRPPARVLIPMG